MQHLQKTGGHILQAKHFSLSSPRHPSPVTHHFTQVLSFHTLAHSFAQRASRICFPFNHLRTLFTATEGAPPTPPFWNSPLTLTTDSTLFIFMRLRTLCEKCRACIPDASTGHRGVLVN